MGVSLLELVISMGLLAVIMLPVISLMATSHKVYTASSHRHDGDYARRTALDAAGRVTQGAQTIVATGANYVDLQFPSGELGRLSFNGAGLTWTAAGTTQLLAIGLTQGRFSVGVAPGANSTAGGLLLVEVASRQAGEPQDSWSSAQFWIRPPI